MITDSLSRLYWSNLVLFRRFQLCPTVSELWPFTLKETKKSREILKGKKKWWLKRWHQEHSWLKTHSLAVLDLLLSLTEQFKGSYVLWGRVSFPSCRHSISTTPGVTQVRRSRFEPQSHFCCPVSPLERLAVMWIPSLEILLNEKMQPWKIYLLHLRPPVHKIHPIFYNGQCCIQQCDNTHCCDNAVIVFSWCIMHNSVKP